MVDVFENLKSAPKRLREASEKLREAPDAIREAPEKIREATNRIRTRGEEVSERLAARVKHLRADGEERLWELEQDALEVAGDLLERVQDVPMVSKVVPGAEERRKHRLQAITAPPIPDYDELNAKTAAAAVRGMGHMDLLKVQRHEAGNKNRKTVLDAVEREMERLARQDEPAVPAE